MKSDRSTNSRQLIIQHVYTRINTFMVVWLTAMPALVLSIAIRENKKIQIVSSEKQRV